jgi:hypothetical protein
VSSDQPCGLRLPGEIDDFRQARRKLAAEQIE